MQLFILDLLYVITEHKNKLFPCLLLLEDPPSLFISFGLK